jgi:hypothetical protein
VSVLFFKNVLPFVEERSHSIALPSILVFKNTLLFVCRGQIPLDKRISSSAQEHDLDIKNLD